MKFRDGRISVYDLLVSGYAKALHAWLERRIPLGSEADIEIAEMVAKVGFSRSTIVRALKELEDAKALKRVPKITSEKGKVASSYVLLDLLAKDQQNQHGSTGHMPPAPVEPSLHSQSLKAQSACTERSKTTLHSSKEQEPSIKEPVPSSKVGFPEFLAEAQQHLKVPISSWGEAEWKKLDPPAGVARAMIAAIATAVPVVVPVFGTEITLSQLVRETYTRARLAA